MDLVYFQLKKKYQILFLISFLLSFIYFVTLPWSFNSVDFIFKGGSIFIFSILVLTALKKKVRFLLFFSFLFATVGDILLTFKFQNAFIFGLASFLIAHIFYIITYVFLRLNTNYYPDSKKWIISLLALYGIIYFLILRPNLGDLFPYVLAYMIVLMTMACFAVTSQLNFFVGFGALLFVFSDSALAFKQFITPFAMDDAMIWFSYYFGQLFIVYGFFSSRKTFLQ